MKTKLTLLCSALLFLGLSSCVDEITLGAGERPTSGMLVQGRLIQGTPSYVEATVYELFLYDNNLPRAVGNSEVLLHDEEGRSVPLIPNYDGTYFQHIESNDPNFPIVAGQRYQLTVTLPNGQGYASAWETLLPVSPLDSVSLQVYEKDVATFEGELETQRFAGFRASTSLKQPGSDGPARYRWETDQAYRLTEDPIHPAYVDLSPKTCYVQLTGNIDKIVVLNGAELSERYLEGYQIWETPADYRFFEGFYLIAYQQSLTDNAFRYFDELAQLLARRGTLFDLPAGAIRTNISPTTDPDALTYGYFYATQQDTFRLYVPPGQVPGVSRRCPYPPPLPGEELPPPNECDDCLLQAGSQLERPEWWIE
ncbi:MAG: DUF4249 family protein [Phaeodactylibacter sp.]|nr:DUF4249 family protein [Phaeodactylibacter sp.]MCB9049577.1 DUF4249 family protein [Lewinellaceae bacterium]